MADIKIAVTRYTLGTTTGNKDITISGFGTPKAAMFIFSRGATDDTAYTGAARFGVGFTDGTTDYCFGVVSLDNSASGDSAREYYAGVIDEIWTNGASARATFNSWITDGVRINVSDAPSANCLVTVILFGGSDLSVDVGTLTMNGTSAVDVTGPGFEPDLVFLGCIGDDNTSLSTNLYTSFGVAVNDGSDTQRVTKIYSDDGAATMNCIASVQSDAAVGQGANDSFTWDGTVGSFDSSGFSVTGDLSGNTDIVMYMAINLGGGEASLFTTTWPTSGNYAETTPGFTPIFGMINSVVGVSTINSITTSGVWGWSLAAFDDSNIYTVNAVDEDGLGTSDTATMSSDQLRILDVDQSNEVIASSYAFDSDGWDFTLSTNPASAFLGWGLAIGAGGGATVSGSITESAAAADACAATVIKAASQAESVSVSDALTAILTALANLTESATPGDAIGAVKITQASQSESATVADAQSAQAVLSAAIAESVTAGDLQVVVITTNASVSESATPADSQSANAIAVAQVLESAVPADAVAASKITQATQAETATVDDTQTAQVLALVAAAITETVSAQDSQTAQLLATANINESAAVLDTVAAQLLATVQIDESATVSDNATAVLNAIAQVQESATATDTLVAVVVGDVVFIVGELIRVPGRGTDVVFDPRPTEIELSARPTLIKPKRLN